MASAVNATAQEARLSILVVPVRVRRRPFIASVASIRRHSCPALIRRQLQNAPPRAASGRIARYMTGRTAFYSSWPGLTPPSPREKPWDPRVKPGDDGLELVHPEYVAFEYALAMIGDLGRSCRRDAMPEFEKRRIGRTSLEV